MAHRVVKVYNATRYKACRGAVLTSIFGRGWMSWGVDEAMRRLRRLWHKKLVELSHEGWERLQDGAKHQYLRNCPPFGCESADSAQRCDVKLICPFCWARRFTLDPFMKVEAALFGGFHPKAKLAMAQPNLTLIEFTRTYKIKPHKNVLWTPEIRAAMVQHAKQIITGPDRQSEVDVFRPLGGVLLHRLDPQVRCWRLTRNGIFICDMPPEFTLPPELTKLKKIKRFNGNRWPRSHITKHRLYQAFAKRFCFPAGVMNADPQDVLLYIEGLRGVRMLSTFGICREKRSQKHF